MNSQAVPQQLSPRLDELKSDLDTIRTTLTSKFLDVVIPLENANGNLSSHDISNMYHYFESLYYEKIRKVHADIAGTIAKQFGSQDAKLQVPSLTNLLDDMIVAAESLTQQKQWSLFYENNRVTPVMPEYIAKLGLDYKKQLPDITIEELAIFLKYLATFIEWKEEIVYTKIASLASWLSEEKRNQILYSLLNKKNP